MRPESIPPAGAWALVQDSRGFPVCRVLRRDPARLGRRTSWSARVPTWSAPTWPTTASWPPAATRVQRRPSRPRLSAADQRAGAPAHRAATGNAGADRWIAVGDPPLIAPRERHEDIWAVQRELNFPGYVWGLPRPAAGSAARSPAGFAGSSAATPRTISPRRHRPHRHPLNQDSFR